ncbi:MAG: hypothetical protein Q8K02_00800, partial [Flavobacterium sp.]|nr:hypothetical protein [Flavobacterium sp.]
MNKFILLGEKIIVGTGKKILLIFLALCFSMCKTPLVNFDDSEETNFNPKNSVLKEFEATESKYSLFIFTSGFEGEEVSITNCNNVIYKGPLKTYEIQPFAKIVRVVNLCDTKFEDINNRISFNI